MIRVGREGAMQKFKVFLIGASCTIFVFCTYHNYKKLFGDKKPDADGPKLHVVRVSHEH